MMSAMRAAGTFGSICVRRFSNRITESVEIKKARLLYQSRKRGILENDLLLSTFAEKYLPVFNEQQLHLYDHLINNASNEWDLYYWAVNARETPKEFDSEVMQLLKEHAKNTKKENRCRQPSLY
ncbi:mitochondrial complex succinate-ubiquinone oxidoreductase subunit 5-like protein [Leptotrombidium deliense]|uniref:Succinate dehydrogenase assembly factor 2, mitochondrial n=1 Tax=Leptotrombidium deliense TaxID=299467 RepID=A0A443SVE4_9ACAR|nr:mitochondrial complex succinate-ubiquinone oxidoreductase subunit 5-like protein [Leptotrombidium deliense]